MIARPGLLLIAVAASSVAAASADPARYMDAKLIAESAAPKPGSTILVGFRFTPKPGWHGYWSNPGDSGIAPTVRWTAPAGVSFGPLLHPAPTLLTADGINSFVHEGPHVLLSKMTVADSVAPGTAIPVKADLNWAACTATQCVPLRATLMLDLVAGDGDRSPRAATLRTATSKLPHPGPAASFTVDGKNVGLRLPTSLRIDVRKARFFPDEGGILNVVTERSAAPLTVSATLQGKAPDAISGVLSDGRNAYRLTFERASPELPLEQTQPIAATRTLAPVAQQQPVEAPQAEPTKAPHPDTRPDTRWLWLMISIGTAVVVALAFARRRKR